MNFTKRRGPERRNDAAVLARLTAITVRSRIECSAYPEPEVAEEAAESAHQVRRRFWRPHELTAQA